MTDQPQLDEPRLDHLIAEYLRRTDRGEAVDVDQLLAAHPDLAEAFRQFLADSDLVQHALAADSPVATAAGISTQSRAEAETPPPAAAPVPPTGDSPLPERLGRYRILQQLGQGAMGAVYLAEDTELQRKVALKVPKFAQRDEPELMQRFYREARAAATLHHPNICPVHDIGEHEGTRYITMAYISGPPLSKLVGTPRLRSERTIAKLVRKLALALAEAHSKGVVHRDLKPANILLDERNEPVITDFGLARRVGQSGEARLTQDGTILGTPAYMAPEQVSGNRDQIGPAGDVYSLGVILYELLTGQLPYRGEIMAVLGQIIQGKPKRPSELRPDVDPRLEAICLKLMAHTPADRYASAAEAASALTRWLEQSPAVRGSQDAVRGSQDAVRASQDAVRGSPTPHTARTEGLPDAADVPDSGRPAVAALGGVGRPAPSAKPAPSEPVDVGGDFSKASISAAEATRAAAKSGDKAPHSKVQAVSKLGSLLPKTLPRPFVPWAIGVAILVALLPLGIWLAGIIVRVKDKQGNVVAEVTVPDGGTGEIMRDGKVVAKETAAAGSTSRADPPGGASSALAEPRAASRGAGSTLQPSLVPSAGWNVGSPLPGLVPNPAQVPGIGRWQIETVMPRERTVDNLEWSPDGRFVACNAGHVVRVYRTTDDYGLVRLLPGPAYPRFSPDGKWLGTVGHREVQLWDLQTGRPGSTLQKRKPLEHGAPRDGQWSPDSRRLVLANGTRLGVWTIDGAPEKDWDTGWDHQVFDASWSPDGKWIAASSGLKIAIWTPDGNPGPALEAPAAGGVLAWSPDGQWLAAGPHPEVPHVHVWSTKTWKLTQTLPRGPAGNAEGLHWSPDSRHLASANMCWNLEDGTKRQLAREYNYAWSPDGARVAFLDISARAIGFSNFVSKKREAILEGHVNSSVSKWQRSPDGKCLATLCDDGRIRLWTADGRPIGIPAEDQRSADAATWSPDPSPQAWKQGDDPPGGTSPKGQFLATPSYNVFLRYTSKHDNRLIDLHGHTVWHTSLTRLWADNEHLISISGDDQTLRYWHVPTAQCLSVSVMLPDGQAAYISHDGKLETTSPEAEKHLVYIVEQRDGELRLFSPAEFRTLVSKQPATQAASNKKGADVGPAPPFAVAPFDAAKAKEHQAAWAKYLGVPVECENSIGMRFMLIPPGEFDMGSTEEEVAQLLEQAKGTNPPFIQRLPAEAPKHRVRITKAFYLGESEVTQAEYERATGSNPSAFKGDPTCPVASVVWYDTWAFCRNLAELRQEQAVHATYRLPTEAEWEYACRAGTTTPWYSGDDVAALAEHAWFSRNALHTTHPVRQKSPNAWGLYDMHGNVGEWCQDWLGDQYYTASPLDDPNGASLGSVRVFRGGGFNDSELICRASFRMGNPIGFRGPGLGFRVAMSIPIAGTGAAGSQKATAEPPQAKDGSTPTPATPPPAAKSASAASKPTAPIPPLDPAWVKKVQTLAPEEQVQEVAAELVRRNPGFDGKVPNHRVEGGRVTDFGIRTDEVTDISPIRVLTGLRALGVAGTLASSGKLADLSPLRGLTLESIWLTNNSNLTDLSPLKGMPLVHLEAYCVPFESLAPLEGMPLEILNNGLSPVSHDLSQLRRMKLQSLTLRVKDGNLEPLRNMPLASLNVRGPVTDLAPLQETRSLRSLHIFSDLLKDISPLKGLRLEHFDAPDSPLNEITALAGMPLKTIRLSKAAIDPQVLRQIKTLETINERPAAEFWQAYAKESGGQKP